MNRWLTPFDVKSNFKGLTLIETLIGVLYFPVILVLWYGYYMWHPEITEIRI